VAAVPGRPQSVSLGPELQRKVATQLFNRAWTLLERDRRDAAESERMVNAAHASRFFGVGDLNALP
jgi:hypothetical protein